MDTKEERIVALISLFNGLSLHRFYHIGDEVMILKQRAYQFRRLPLLVDDQSNEPIGLFIKAYGLAKILAEYCQLDQNFTITFNANETALRQKIEKKIEGWDQYLKHILDDEDWLITLVECTVSHLMESGLIKLKTKNDDFNRQWTIAALGNDHSRAAKKITNTFWPKPQ